MEFVNETQTAAAWTLGFQKNGREFVCVVAKTTFVLPPDQEVAWLADKQFPVVEADEFVGEPGRSALVYESDFAHEKPYCDVLLNGSAYAPRGVPCVRVCVGLQVGPVHKRLEVTGDRCWEVGRLGVSATPPQPFAQKVISYDDAYGGTSESNSEPELVHSYVENPIGKGFYPLETNAELDGKPLANSNEVGTSSDDRKGSFRPMAFGAVGRNFKDRAKYAGTYDESWQTKQAPFLPKDFDCRYFQAAPQDQQMPCPQAPLEFTLENLTRDGLRRFSVPVEQIPVMVYEHHRDPQQYDFKLDTVVIEPDFSRVLLVRRLSIPLRKSVFDISQIVVGQSYKHYRDVRQRRKKRYNDIDEMIKANRKVAR